MKLLVHMKEQHPKSELLTSNELACPFCQELLPGKRLQRLKHIGSHMEEIALTAITRAYEDWTFYSDSEKYLSSVCGEERHRDKKVSGSLDLPSARSGLQSAPEESTAVQTGVKISSSTAKDATVAKQSSQARPIAEDEWHFFGEENMKLRRKTRSVSKELKSAKVSAVSAENRADGLDATPPQVPPRFDKDLAGGHHLGWGWSKQQVGPSSQNHDDGNSPSQPRSQTKDAEAAAEAAGTGNRPPETIKQARKAENLAKRGEVLRENATVEPQPDAHTTRPSEQMGRAQPKKSRPRVERTGGASSWGDWRVSYAPRKTKKTSVS
jgi:hypothetical protein